MMITASLIEFRTSGIHLETGIEFIDQQYVRYYVDGMSIYLVPMTVKRGLYMHNRIRDSGNEFLYNDFIVRL